MPKVYLTQAQREQAAIDKIRVRISDGIAVQKVRKKLSNEQVAKGLELGRNTVGHILNGDDVKLPINQTLRLLRFAGLQVVAAEQYTEG